DNKRTHRVGRFSGTSFEVKIIQGTIVRVVRVHDKSLEVLIPGSPIVVDTLVYLDPLIVPWS
ncbi:hypothetical protein HAX54_030641, partial [Datura stramonium]|nr:hypothetical protein [Datura stramonium]